MRRRMIVAGVGAGLAVGLLVGLTAPAPRLRLPLPGVRPDSSVGIYQAEAAGQAARWAFLQDATHQNGWAFDHRTGRLHGPYPVPGDARGYVADAAGRLYAHAGLGTAVGGFPLAVWRVDPETGRYTPYYEVADRLHITPTTWGGEPAWLTFAGSPLRLEVIDLATGTVRRRIDFPGRAGGLIDNGGPFAGGWEVSADGRWLALGESWDGLRRTTLPGIELWDLPAGRLARRISYPLPDPDRGGCSSVRFTPDGRLRFAGVTRHQPGTAVIPLLAAYWRVRLPDGPCEPDPDDEPDLPDLYLPAEVDAVGDRRLYRGDGGREDGTLAFVVTDAGRPLHPRRLVPGSEADSISQRLRLTAAGNGVVSSVWRPGGPSAAWLRAPLGWLGVPPADPTERVDWHDWQSDSVRRLGVYPSRDVDFACQPGGIVVCFQERAAGRAELEVWADPPPGWPPLPVWLVVAATGGLLGWRFGRRRAGRPPTPPVP